MQFKKANATIEEVAKKANVSKTTISRYINGKFEYMSEETRKRIQEVIEELDYHPNSIARSLKSNKSGLIGALIGDITSPFSSVLVKGIGDICQENGYQVIISNTDNNSQKEKICIQSLIDSRVEGIILNTVEGNNELLTEIRNQGIPIVQTDKSMNELSFENVSGDAYETTYNIIKYLIEIGIKKVAFFTEEFEKDSSTNTKMNAYLDACSQFLGIDAKDLIYVIDSTDENVILNSIKDFVYKNKKEIKLIFTANGVLLFSVLNGIRKLGLKIPEDVGICEYEKWGWSPILPPSITVISQPAYQVGISAAKRVIAKIKKKNTSSY